MFINNKDINIFNMETYVINNNKDLERFRTNKGIEVDGNLKIKCSLIIKKSLITSGFIEAGEHIKAVEHIEAAPGRHDGGHAR